MVECADRSPRHLSVRRVKNTAKDGDFEIADHVSNIGDVAIDPYGFDSRTGFDPWALVAFPKGALSVNLWKSGEAPDRGGWE